MAERFQSLNELSGSCDRIQAIEIITPGFDIGSSIFQNLIGDDQNLVTGGNDRFRSAAPGFDAVLKRSQVALLGMRDRACCLRENPS